MNPLGVSFCGSRLRNPTVLASGILGITFNQLKRAEDGGAGAVTTKSIGPEERVGNRNPTCVALQHGMLNAMGLPSPGYEAMDDEWRQLKKMKVPVFASIYGASVEDFRRVAAYVAEKKPALIELNVSCPNTAEHGQVFGFEPSVAASVVETVKEVSGRVPVSVKLTPNTYKIVAVARACEEAGADAICAINTVAGMAINIEARKPVLSFKKGGYSGPAIKPIAIRCVYDIYEAVKIPILGVGGVTTGRDAIEMMQAGATAVGIGSGVYYRGPNVFGLVAEEMRCWMHANGVASAKSLIGAAHD
ncbi:Dihydroorotate dehydrogenase [Candidatus Norongarragalina meridionalis]|nr:Dihydroorotate dehydrogenase [Candidatus Norongarragalina meridionalis]